MPDREVETIQDLIYYQYAKVIARSAFAVPNGKVAKSQHYGFIKNTFRQLKRGQKSWSEISVRLAIIFLVYTIRYGRAKHAIHQRVPKASTSSTARNSPKIQSFTI